MKGTNEQIPGIQMTTFEFVTELADRSVYLSGDGDSLKYRAPEGVLDESLRFMLRQFKDELIKTLTKHAGYSLICPLSYNQQSLFFMHLLEPASAAYNLALTMRFQSSVDVEAMRKAVERLVQLHGQLRTTFSYIELGESLIPVQIVRDKLSPSFEVIDAHRWTDTEWAEELQSFYRIPFDLEDGPMVRVGLFTRGESETTLLMVFHHIVTDALSLNKIMRDLATAYCDKPEDGARTEASSEYTDFALAQRRELEEPTGRAHLDYWLMAHKSPAPILDLSSGSKRPIVRRSVGATHYFDLDVTTCKEIERVAQELGITTFALLLSVFQWLLLERSGHRDITIGIPVMTRNNRRFENTVGYFINPIPFRSRRTGALRFSDHARTTGRELLTALDHRDAPFAAVVEQLGGVRDTAHTPVFQVMFNMLSRKTLGDVTDLLYPLKNTAIIDFGGLKATACALNQQEGQFDLTLELIDSGDGILALLKYCTDLFSDSEASDLAAAFRTRLDNALANPEIALFGSTESETVCAKLDGDAPVIAISASFTAEVMQEFLEFWLQRLGWNSNVRFAQFNQIFQELLSPSSLLRSNRQGHNVVMVRFDDLLDGGLEHLVQSSKEKDKSLALILDELFQAVATAVKGMPVPLLFVLCPSSPAGEEVLRLKEEIVERFLEALRSLPGVTVLTHKDIYHIYPVDEYYEPFGETIGRIPFTHPYFAALSTTIVRSLHALSHKPVKALAVDCDGTLWNGVAAEDGATGVFIGPSQRAFQKFLLEQHQAGVVLCICSKNQETDVWAVFDQHPDMLLRREHFPFWKINWEPKSSNLRALAREINIGIDAIAFLDDNPLERAEVSAHCPSVFCLEFPEAWEDRAAWLEHVWLLDRGHVTAEDRKRQEHYQSEQIRENLKQSAGSLTEFLEKLELKIDLNPADEADYDRLAQLSVRTNQFNTTTLRLTPQEVVGYATTPGLSAHIARVRDRFGDYGLVGGMLARSEEGSFRVDGMFLSCRALGRGVEFRMASYLASIAKNTSCSEIVFPVQSTQRNEPARSFLARLNELCGGTRDDKNGLHLNAERLAEFRYETLQQPEETTESTEPREASDSSSGNTSTDRELSLVIARELRSVDAILNAVEERTRNLQSMGTPRIAVGPAIPPGTKTEQVIANVWKRVLGLDEINTQAKFFEVGGTSLLMARIAIDLKRNHGFDVSIIDMFQYPAIADLAAHLDQSSLSDDVAGQTAAATAIRQREVLNARNLPDAFRRLKESADRKIDDRR
jgi:FkbH-like protein